MDGDKDKLDVDAETLQLVGTGVTGLAVQLAEIRAEVDALNRELPLGSSPHAEALSRKFADRAAQFRDLLDVMETQLVFIADELGTTASVYRQADDGVRETLVTP
ncbi:type VII secretion target [Actinosynnema sp. NPDC023658]|uniref:WXG100 family type VII secretion target n=1 Tax=Actinosynnema sp. NPDC023658 TaxID=3155465 RepID=UPI003407188E